MPQTCGPGRFMPSAGHGYAVREPPDTEPAKSAACSGCGSSRGRRTRPLPSITAETPMLTERATQRHILAERDAVHLVIAAGDLPAPIDEHGRVVSLHRAVGPEDVTVQAEQHVRRPLFVDPLGVFPCVVEDPLRPGVETVTRDVR